MAPIQKTFTLIPQRAGTTCAGDSPARPSPARPMTSKQVRKAYKAANKMPQMSRAERIKQDRVEQERIRKELEKEKAAAKAKVAREKKRVKEMAEREEKKKNRLPLVNVRPSQDTIARFVRGNGTGRKRDSGGEELEAEDDSLEPVHLVRNGAEAGPAKETITKPGIGRGPGEGAPPQFAIESASVARGCLHLDPIEETAEPIVGGNDMDWIPEEDGEELDVIADEAVAERVATTNAAEYVAGKNAAGKDATGRQNSPHLDNAAGPDLISEEDDLEPELAAGEDSNPHKKQTTTHLNVRDEPDLVPSDDLELDLLSDEDLHEATKLPAAQNGLGSELDLIPEEDDFELAMLQELDEFSTTLSEEQTHDEPMRSQHEDKRPCDETPRLNNTRPRKPTPIEQDLGLHTSSPEAAPINTPPAQVAQSARQAVTPLFTPSDLGKAAAESSPSPPRQAPPMSTQAILCNFDDFFPTSSQQARELEGDSGDELEEPDISPSKHTPQTQTSKLTKPQSRIPSPPSNRPPSQPPTRKQSSPHTQASPSQPSKRFFTSSGSNELLSLAIHRSRRTAALEQLRQREQGRAQNCTTPFEERGPAESKQRSQRVEATKIGNATRTTGKRSSQTSTANRTSTNTPTRAHAPAPVPAPVPTKQLKPNPSPDKENIAPDQPCVVSDSQETEYGGDWVDEIALELEI